MKICNKCKQQKELTEFHKWKHSSDGHDYKCKSCKASPTSKAYRKEWHKNNRDKIRNSCLKSDFGINLDQYNQMLKNQNDVCAICEKSEIIKGRHGKIKHLAVDHCHTTGKVRGLLCSNCNLGIGKLQENAGLIFKAAEYVSAKR